MINVAIIGASGYTGLELIKILINHKEFNICYIADTSGNKKIEDLHPSLNNVLSMSVEKADSFEVSQCASLAFLALPHKASMGFASELLALGVKVVDLSADYRLSLDTYEEHYCEHTDKKNLEKAVYGLPEFFKKDIKKANLVANPGCYPTASLLALLPFIDYIDENAPVFIDAKSGVSGAGKKLSEITSFCNINENIFAYNPLEHRHMPEIEEKIKVLKNKELSINFVPHLINVTRGMLVSVYATLKEDSKDVNVQKVLNNYYEDENFVRIKSKPVDIKSVAGTNFCDIFAVKHKNAIFINTSIDNLLRGASSQAICNANIMCGFDENLGIPNIAYVP